jgi:hypothetical protein
MKILFSTFSALALVAGLALIAAPEAVAQTQTSTSEFEFLKATEDRVWRLNRQTGEIAVCTLERETLLCSTSSGAAQTPATSYEELKQREAAELASAEAKDKEERERAMRLLDRMVEVFKEFTSEATSESTQ